MLYYRFKSCYLLMIYVTGCYFKILIKKLNNHLLFCYHFCCNYIIINMIGILQQ